MGWLGETWHRLRSIGRRDAIESGLDDEIRFHVDQQTDKYIREGLSPADARRRALVAFGAMERAKESTRDEFRPALLEDAVRDVRHGIRLLMRAPGFTGAAVVTLALGIGATAAIFSIVRTVLLEPLPYREPDRVVAIWETNRGGTSRNVIAPANFVQWRERARTLQHLGMAGPASLDMMVNGAALSVQGMALSAEGFVALGVQPTLGRTYTNAEDYGGNMSVLVLGHDFWQGRLGGRTDVLGLTLSTNDGPKTVLGVMPPGFTVAGQKADFLVPYRETLAQMRTIRGRGASYAIGRLGPGVSFDEADAEMRGIYAALEKEAPQLNARRTVMLFRLHDQMVSELTPAIFTLMGAVGLVLLVACVNVANLLLARSAARENELGMRTALGAGRGRLIRQMLTESLLLSVTGGVAGLAVAALCHEGLLALVGDRIPVPRLDQVSLDLAVVAFTMATALATGLLFGVVPAFVSTRQARDAIRDSGRHGRSRRQHRLLGALVVAEVALSLVLLTGAGLLMRSLVKLQQTDLGFRPDGVLTAAITLPGTRYEVARAQLVFRDGLARVGALPGVERAAGASCMPLPHPCIGTSFWRTDLPKPPDGQLTSGHVRPVTPGFFRTLGIPQVSGRDFSDGDTAESAPVAIISDELARQHFPDGNPLGRRLRINVDHANGKDDVEWTVIGVVASTRSALDGPMRQTIYLPRVQRPGNNLVFFVRTAQDPESVAAGVAAAISALEPEAPVEMRTLEDVVGATIARPRAISVLLGFFALVALLLAAVGVYGVMAYSVRERTQEIGVRMALGASATSVFRLVLVQALRLVLLGVIVGLVAAGALTRVLERLLFGVEPLDPWTFATTAVVLLLVASIASWLPAWRGMRIAPNEALRVN